MMGYWEYGYNNPGYHFFGGIAMIIFWAIIIGLIVMLVRRSRMHGPHMHGGFCCGGHEGGRALEVLRERYAKGEIDKKEFEEKKKDLMS